MPLQEAGAAVDLTDVIEEAKGRGLKFPLLIRFQDILRHRVEAINQAFRNSIAEFNYQGKYRGVFPIKVNQLREVVEEILDAGKPFDFGLEVGSKPELFAGLALQNQQGCLIICNGYKDAEFIQMALLGIKLGKKVIMVVEKLEELNQIIAVSKQLGVEPHHRHPRAAVEQGRGQMGRERRRKRQVRPEHGRAADGDGNVEGGKPGPLLQAAAFPHRLAGAGYSDDQKSRAGGGALLRQALQDGFRHRIHGRRRRPGRGLRRQPLSAFDSSTNYTLQEYTNDIVYYIADVCNAEKVPHPNIISESGRAIVAHHSVLIVEVFGAIEKIRPGDAFKYGDNEHALVRDLLDIKKNLAQVEQARGVSRRAGTQGGRAADVRARPAGSAGQGEDRNALLGDQPARSCKVFAARLMSRRKSASSKTRLGDQYLCNFSVFQSLLDHWALGQLFPIMPSAA